jgi:uncharacterized protein
MASRVSRWDIGPLGKAEELENGYLRAEGYLTRTGVFEYPQPDGSVQRELRLPDEVFHVDSMKSFEQLPVTDTHPPQMLDANNTRSYARGNVGSDVQRDGDFVRAPFLITDAQLIKKMKGGVREVSNGYTCELENSPGVWEGQSYDVIQRSIRGNHVAIVDEGRAGEGAVVRLDSKGAVTMPAPKKDKVVEVKKPRTLTVIHTDEYTGSAKCKDDDGNEFELPLKSLKHMLAGEQAEKAAGGAGAGEEPPAKKDADPDADVEPVENTEEKGDDDEEMDAEEDDEMGVEGDEPPAAKSADKQGRKDAKKVQSRKDSLDARQARLDAQERRLAKLEAESRERNRLAIVKQVRPVLGQRFDGVGMTPRQIREAALDKLCPDERGSFAVKSASYIRPRFDAELKNFLKGAAVQTQQYGQLAGRNDASNGVDVEEVARKARDERLANAWKTGAAKGN